MRKLASLGSFVLLLSFLSTPKAAPLVELIVNNSSATPELQGARNVLVGAGYYDVVFLDGTCDEVFQPCIISSFTFQTAAQAKLASQALLDQVFLDVSQGAFDSIPNLTRGCSREGSCEAATPWNNPASSDDIQVEIAFNQATSVGPDGLTSASPLRTSDFSDDTALFWARWSLASSVPEPTTLALMTLGLAGIVYKRHRSKKAL